MPSRIEFLTTMSTWRKLALFVLVLPYLGRVYLPLVSAQATSTEQTSSPPKRGEFTLEPIDIPVAVYPPVAKEQKIQGKVIGMILASETGEVENIQIFKSDPLLAAAAEEAAKKWKFKPVLKDSKPAAVVAKATFNFILSDDIKDTKDVAAEIGPASDFPAQVRVSNGVMRSMLVRKVDPNYPEKARKARIEGTVEFRTRISKEGRIADLQVVSGPDALVPAATEAVRLWQYKPYSYLGRPVDVETLIQITSRSITNKFGGVSG